MYIMKEQTLILVSILFLAGLYFMCSYTPSSVKENFDSMFNTNCPNLLLQKDNKYFLYNTTKEHVPGVNPVEFDNLEEYKEFVDWLRGSGIKCPILFAKQTYTTQGDRSYKFCPNNEPENGGLPQTNMPIKEQPLLNAGHNKGSMPAFDPQNQYIGEYTKLDSEFHEEERNQLSDNPIDTNWGGAQYSRKAVSSGKYKDDNVSLYVS